jgi:hypothetical protein
MTDHVALMREFAGQLRAQADRYEQAADLIEGEGAPPARRPAKVAATLRSGGKAVGDELARHRAAVEAKGLTVAAEELGVTYNTLYYQAKRGKWKLPKSAPRAAKAATVPTPKRRCDAEGCGKVTNSDPCAHCGAPWLRSK